MEECFRCVRYGTAINCKYLVKLAMGVIIQIRTTDFGIGVWFIPCIFVAFLLLNGIKKISGKSTLRAGLLSILCLIIGYLYCTYIDIKLPWGIDAAFVAVGFMAVGNLFRANLMCDFHDTRMLGLTMVISLIVNVIFVYLNHELLHRTVGMWSNNYGNLIFFLLESLSGILFTIAATNLAKCKLIKRIGHNSIYYYGIHILLVESICSFAVKIPGVRNSVVISFFVSILVMIVILAILTWLYPSYERIYNFLIKKVLNR